MMSPRNPMTAVASKVWVVMFDVIQRPASLDIPVGANAEQEVGTDVESIGVPEFSPGPLDAGLQPSDSSNRATGFNAFDDLDVQSDYFEQFVAQNVSESATEAERLGGANVVRATLQAIQQRGLIEAIRIRPKSPGASSQVARESIIEVVQGLHGDTREMTLPENASTDQSSLIDLSSLMQPSLIWFSVDSGQAPDPEWFQEFALRTILNWQQSIPSNQRPMLMVTGLIGIARPLGDPLESSLDENRIHLPLWIDQGLHHPRRIQSLVGSFDLLPTIADAFGCESICVAETAPEASRPISALALCHRRFDRTVDSDDPRAQPDRTHEDRILPICGDHWTALRAQQYLLVRKMSDNSNDEIGDTEIVRQLFLKPDDAWNVNDMIVPFEAIADEMEARVPGEWTAENRTNQ